MRRECVRSVAGTFLAFIPTRKVGSVMSASEQQYWVAGYNLSPYAPDPDNLFVTGEWSDALTYLVDTLELWWDQEYELVEPDEFGSSDADAWAEIDGRYLDAHTALHNASQGELVSVTITNNRGHIEHLWIGRSTEVPESN